MKNITKLISVFIVIAVIFCCSACSGSIKADAQNAVLPDINPPQSVIYIINRADLNDGEYSMVASLQGICAQSEARIYIEDGSNYIMIEDYIKNTKNLAVKKTSDVKELISENIDYIKDSGCVVFEEGSNSTVNMAFTVSGMEKWLAVPSGFSEDAKSLGLEIKQDLTIKENGKYIVTQEDLFEKYKDKLNKNIIVHQSPELVTLRDYAAATGAFCFYTDESSRLQVKFREKVFSWANKNATVLGWSADELGYVKQASKCAISVVPSDHCSNLSLLSSFPAGDIQQKNNAENIIPDENKHYIALVMSDGDNIQWYQTTFPYRGHFYDRINTANDYKLTWTAPPILYKLAPSVLQYVYNAATDKDRFVCGVSGIGYINPTAYNKEALADFVSESVDAMKKADLQTITVLDNSKSMNKLSKAMAYYSAQDYISGGLMQIEYKYEALKGKTLFSDGKPFVSAAKSFWFTSENEDETISREWIEAFAQEINSLPADIYSEMGYSYINIHPWSTSIEDLNYLVSLLDEHIEIVYGDELVDMIKENVIL